MFSLTIRDMFSNTFDDKQNTHDVETKYSELSNLFRIKQDLHKNTRLKNAKLNQKLRDTQEEARQLKLTIARTANKKTKLINAHKAEIDQLQKSILELKDKNTDLKNRITDVSNSEDSECVSDLLQQSIDKAHNDSDSLVKSQNGTIEGSNLKFSPQFQALLDRHSEQIID